MAVTWNAENAAHLLRRSGFEATPKQIQSAVKRGLEKSVASILKIKKTNDKLPKDTQDLDQLQAWWLELMMKSKSPLGERLTLFWHNHFATGFAKVGNIAYMHAQNQVFRKLGAGSFRDLVVAVARDPAMIIWLDNNTNVKGKPNQNFARELMELFTTGVLDKNGAPNYTEVDVDEGAKAFTGWTIANGAFFFDANKHDFGNKSFRGSSGPLDGMDVIENLVVDPATARRIPAQLFGAFAYPIPLTHPLLDELSTIYLDNDTAILPVLQRIFLSDEFYSAEAKDAGISEPAVFLACAFRALKAKLQKTKKNDEKKIVSNTGALGDQLEALGQSLFDPPSVFGWDYGLDWVSAAGMLSRAKVADWIAEARSKDHVLQYKPDKILGPGSKKLDATQAAERILVGLGIVSPAPTSVTALAAYMAAQDNGTPGPFEVTSDTIDKKVRGAIALVLSSTEFQRV